MSETSKQPLSLQFVISTGIVLAMVILASVLLLLSYNFNREVLIEASQDKANTLAQQVESDFAKITLPAQQALRLLSWDPITQARDVQSREERIPILVEVLKEDELISAVYAGYPDGDFVLARSLNNPEVRRALNAPEQARYLIQLIDHTDSNTTFAEWVYLDEDRTEVQRLTPDDIAYDPRQRPWYRQALADKDIVITPPYVFYTTREVGLTFARNSQRGAVLGLDYAVTDLSNYLANQKRLSGMDLALVTTHNDLVAYTDSSKLVNEQGDLLRLATVDDLDPDTFSAFLGDTADSLADDRWVRYRLNVADIDDLQLDLLIAIPYQELLSDVRQHEYFAAAVAISIGLLLLIIGWRAGHILALPLKELASQVDHLAAFKFDSPVGVPSRIREVQNLSQQLSTMGRAVQNFKEMAYTLSAERDLDQMLKRVNHLLNSSVSAKCSLVYLYDFDNRTLQLTSHWGRTPKLEPTLSSVAEDVESQLGAVYKASTTPADRQLALPLLDRKGQCMGVFCIEPEEASLLNNANYRAYVTELTGYAATAIETRRLLNDQERLIDAIIQVLADAIDAKSPYTMRHCTRVPVLTEMLLKAAEATTQGPLAPFKMADDERYAVHIASWLHDCGKITSPEYVIDKASKLEMLYNRIHEIRTRFEVLWRDAEIHYLKRLLAGDAEPELRAQLKQRQAQLKHQFGLVASANTGESELSEAEINEIKAIGRQTWTRHFDRRLGLSIAELERIERLCLAEILPATETLLSDRGDHLIEWDENRPPVRRDDPRNVWGFDMEVPEQEFNYGELYNLLITKGTLTEEERFKVNEHAIQTIIMLKALPLPRALRNVPDIAGNHHERIDGQGYPRKLQAGQLSVPERVMAIADVFEALTAIDRPYKPPKTLSEALLIQAQMVANQHLDPDLFELFVRDQVYLDYAHKHLAKEQIDKVDQRAILALARGQRQGG